MPVRDFRESMYVQYSEGFPGARVNIENRQIHFETDERFYEELEPFYQAVIEKDIEFFKISRDYALGLHLFLETLDKNRGVEKPPWLKGQVTGALQFRNDCNRRKEALHRL